MRWPSTTSTGVDRRSYAAAFDTEEDAHACGGRLEAGLRLRSAGLFAEPRASLTYSRASLGDLTADGGAFDYDRFTGVRGRAGLRLGRLTEIAASAVAFYVDGAVGKEFEGRDGLRFANGGQVVDIRADRLGTYGQGALA